MGGRVIRQLRLRGLVQGVGFRPYVWRLAGELGLSGWVRNDGEGVIIQAAGARLAEFRARLPKEIPPLARIDAIEESERTVDSETLLPEDGWLEQGGFAILDSQQGAVTTAIGPDAALCPDCLADVCDPANRRWRYALTTCTHCGPRYTVSAGVPYDRASTSLAPFALCPACTAEYTHPADRRFHAETTCCPDCGPQVRLLDAHGQPLPGDPLAEALALLRQGRLLAIKGLGGFHVACDARNAAAVAELRQRKAREAKPFAVMGLNPASLAAVARVDVDEAAYLHSPAAPIVLCQKAGEVLDGVAPGLDRLGLMLPATPLQALLWHEAAGRPSGVDWLAAPSDLLLVMTSANPHGEPLVATDAEAQSRLAGIADAFLTHNRDIVVRCDDSVLRVVAGRPHFIRRARGYTPLPIPLPGRSEAAPTVLAVGGHLKNTVCVLKGGAAYLSQHIGGLDNRAAIDFQEESITHLLDILQVRPDILAHDLHPDYASTRLALQLAEHWQIPALGVGHHHAHLAAIAAERGVRTPLIGLALDGVGLGTDATAWGGELLRMDGADCQRLGHLQPLCLPGGDRAAREPWRLAVAALHQAGLAQAVAAWASRCCPQHDTQSVLELLNRRLRCPPTSSLGRWFDAVAGLLGVCELSQYEGQAAMLLEARAVAHGPVAPLAEGWQVRWQEMPGAQNAGEVAVLDLSPMLPALLVAGADRGAALFHATLAAALADWCRAVLEKRAEGATHLAVGGGCALNACLMQALRTHLAAEGVSLLEAEQVPPNDGGLALGQAWVAAQQFEEA